ncbi:hypothetical protein [Streptomyces sp. NPDC086787]|uniref:hypothetical protein n=1 Tax=Streptomyces sp. NPDC086787 TaxID=3365759 RepID=UPI0037F15934
MFQETPIYNRLIAERGDIPARVRGEADRIRRDLAQVLRAGPGSPVALLPQPSLPGPRISPDAR